MNIGDRVTVTKKMDADIKHSGTYAGAKSREMIVIDIDRMECIFLGTGQRWSGAMESDDAWDAMNPVYYWQNHECHNVYLCQPIDIGGRYRKPIAVPLEGLDADDAE